MSSSYRASVYNHAIPHGDQWLVFNGVSSALVLLDQPTFLRLEPYLFAERDSIVSRPHFRPVLNRGAAFDLEGIHNPELRSTLEQLIDAQYLVEENLDELDSLRQRYRIRQNEDPLLVTVVPTMDCNLGCYYCYEEKYPSRMSLDTCDRIYDYIVHDLSTRNQKRMHLGWFGGEPMLNRDAIDYLSAKLWPYCKTANIRYSVSMVSNGTVWPSDPQECRDFVLRNKIGSIQFSFDGLAKNHNNRRHYINGNSRHEVSSFDALSRTVEALRGIVKQYLRLNLDKGNKNDVQELIEYFRVRGWFDSGSKIYPYLAALSPYTDACTSVNQTAVDPKEFDEMENGFRDSLGRYIDLSEFVYANYPRALPLNCSAVAKHSVIFGPDGEMYKCPHDLGVKSMTHGHLDQTVNSSASLFQILNNRSNSAERSAAHDYPSYDPFANSTCSQCRYLPNCLGGCPKEKFDDRQYYLGSICETWETIFEPMVRNFADSLQRTQAGAVAML